MTVEILRVPWSDERGAVLRRRMGEEMNERYAGRHDDDPDFPRKAAIAFTIYPDTVLTCVLAVDGGIPVGHAALRRVDDYFELKNVIVAESHRGRGVGRALLAEIERATVEAGGDALVLQTGDRQPEAVALYEKLGWERIPPFGNYTLISNSICFRKSLADAPAASGR